MGVDIDDVPARQRSSPADHHILAARRERRQELSKPVQVLLWDGERWTARTAMRSARTGHAPAVRFAVRMHLPIAGLGVVVLDTLLVRQEHRAGPAPKVVDHGHATPAAGFAGGGLLSCQIHAFLDPPLPPGLVAVRAGFGLERFVQIALRCSRRLLLLGDYHTDRLSPLRCDVEDSTESGRMGILRSRLSPVRIGALSVCALTTLAVPPPPSLLGNRTLSTLCKTSQTAYK